MPVDYRDAAARHFEDANHLHSMGRWANADHLFGLSAECALKAVMLALGMRMNPKKPDKPEARYAVHIDKLWMQFPAFASGRQAAKYAALMEPQSNPFQSWDVNQRYHHRSEITRERADQHKDGAEKARAVLKMAELDGVII